MNATLTGRSARLLVLAVSAGALAACSGGEKNGAAAGGDTATPTTTPMAAGDSASAAAAPGAAAPVTGQTVDVKMVLDGANYRFQPENVTIHPGDAVRWTMVSGGPHDVSFWADSIPAGMASVLQANMPNTMSPLVGPMLMNANDTYTISFGNAKPGVYKYYCTPHLAMGMKAQITVE